jgi:hypothetical protein
MEMLTGHEESGRYVFMAYYVTPANGDGGPLWIYTHNRQAVFGICYGGLEDIIHCLLAEYQDIHAIEHRDANGRLHIVYPKLVPANHLAELVAREMQK